MKKLRRGRVFNHGVPAGVIEETPGGFRFSYDPDYLLDTGTNPVSLTLPKRAEPYDSRLLFPFFHGMLAEGPLREIQCRTLRLDERDAFGRLLATCGGDVIGSVTVHPLPSGGTESLAETAPMAPETPRS